MMVARLRFLRGGIGLVLEGATRGVTVVCWLLPAVVVEVSLLIAGELLKRLLLGSNLNCVEVTTISQVMAYCRCCRYDL
jgi:hypothetical protein